MKVVTHDGNFHSDDIFAVATLLLVFPSAQIIRSRDLEEINSADLVVDVGEIYDPKKMRFDHHQSEGAGRRENGVPYASFGLIWKEFGEQLSGKEEKEIIEAKLVLPIDAIDNGITLSTQNFKNVREYSIQDYLFSYVDHSKTDQRYLFEVFMKLVGIAKDLIIREINRAQQIVLGMKKVREIVQHTEDRRIIVLPEDLPWSYVLVKEVPEALYVVYPRKTGAWGVRAVPKDLGTFDMRKPLPEGWTGKVNENLAAITRVGDAIFMHRGRFLASAHSKEGALKLAEIALNA